MLWAFHDIPCENLFGLMVEPSEQYELVSWDDEIPNIWKSKIDVPNHQPEYGGFLSQTRGYSPGYPKAFPICFRANNGI